MNNINTQYTVDPICPFCGYVFSDAWEFGIAWGVVKIVFAGTAGILCAICLLLPGYYNLSSD